MKVLKYIFCLSAVSLFTACHDLTEINENPNNINNTHPQLLLTEIETTAFAVEGTSALYASRMLVGSDGEDSNQYFTWTRGNYNYYSNMREVIKMEEEAKRIGSSAYAAVAKFFKAYYFYKLTLTFGDIPYSESLKGENNVYTPIYDTQKAVFQGILNELTQANQLLKNANEVLSGDVIYGGNIEKWQKLVNSFRLKVLLTLSKKTSDSDLNITSTFAQIYSSEPIFTSNADDAQLIFYDQLGSRYTEFNSSSYGSARYMSGTFISLLTDLQDPRLFIFADMTRNAKENGLANTDFNAYNGGDPIAPYNDANLLAVAGNISKVNERYYTDPTTEPHIILSFSELSFILAEASVRGWISDDAQTHYENGIKSNFKFYNTYGKLLARLTDDAATATYLSVTNVSFNGASTDEEKINKIITQKYITSFLQGGWRMYFEYLRTGYPELAQIATNTPPTRWMYPNGEYTNNAKNVSDAVTSQFGAGNDETRQIPWWLK